MAGIHHLALTSACIIDFIMRASPDIANQAVSPLVQPTA